MGAVTPRCVEFAFGDFVLDRERRQVQRADGGPLPLTPRLFNALELFIERPGELLHKDALMLALWPGRVVEENSLSQLIHSLRRSLGDDGNGHRYIQTEPRRGFRFVVPVTRREAASPSSPGSEPGAASRAAISTLAVLPFVSIASQATLDLLELGMADSLIARLSTVPGLVLRSVGSVRRFAGPDRDLGQAARLLDAAWIIDGTLQHAGDRLRVNVRLLSMPGGVAAWSCSFTVAFTDVFDVQDRICEQVAQALSAPLGGQVPWAAALAAARVGGTRNVDAYQLYLGAQQQAQSLRDDGLAKSIELYRQAIAVDEHYALAHLGIAESCRRMVFGADGDPSEVLDRPRRHVLQALAMAPELADAHAQLAWIHWWYDFDWPRAEQTFRRALALNPNVAHAHFGLGHLLMSTLGRIEEGMAHVRIARELDPLSLLYSTLEAGFMAAAGDTTGARGRLERVLQMEPRFWIAHLTVGTLALDAGEHATAIEAFQRSDKLVDGSSQAVALLGVALGRAGRAPEARAVLARLQALARTRYVPPTSLAAVHAALSETGPALGQLERARQTHDARLTYMNNDFRWRDLRGQPRFAALLERMHLDRCPQGLSPP